MELLASRRRWAAIALLIVVLLAACGGGGGGGSAGAPTPDLSVGEEVYVIRCAGCHAPDGSGTVGPDIRPPKLFERYPQRQGLEDIVAFGGQNMPEFASKLTPDEISAVIDYVIEELAVESEGG